MQQRKNKNFLDGVLKCSDKLVLYDAEGKVVTQTKGKGNEGSRYGAGSELVIGNWELEVEGRLAADAFR